MNEGTKERNHRTKGGSELVSESINCARLFLSLCALSNSFTLFTPFTQSNKLSEIREINEVKELNEFMSL